jgi:hypothetical protein
MIIGKEARQQQLSSGLQGCLRLMSPPPSVYAAAVRLLDAPDAEAELVTMENEFQLPPTENLHASATSTL